MARKILYIEATSGVAGDMLLGAFLDLGVPPEVLNKAWSALGLDNYEIEVSRVQKAGMRAIQCRVKTQEKLGPKTWKQYQTLLRKAKLKDSVRASALSLIRKLFEIEASVHGTSLEKLHLHEMGGTDLLIDVIGTLVSVDTLEPSCIVASPLNTGKGFVQFSHGKYPVPVPATSILLEGVPVFQNEVSGELTTPTGALLVTHLAQSYGDLPEMKLRKLGVGAGEKETPLHPNVVRMFWGTQESDSEEAIFLAETNIDDSNPQILAYFMEKAFEQGALDVFFTPIIMKKNRPAIRLSLLASESKLETLLRLLFAETTAIGLRYWKVNRRTLERRWTSITLGGSKVRIKESYLDGSLYNYQPEYEDCKKLAEKLKRPLKEILSQANSTYLKKPL